MKTDLSKPISNRARLAVVFPGQGSQTPGMGRELLTLRPWLTERLTELSAAAGVDLEPLLVAEAPDGDLLRTHLTMVSYGLLAWEALLKDGCRPVMVAGHSLGEITALACAGALSAEEALGLAAARGRFMAEACAARPGAMYAFVGAPMADMLSSMRAWIDANDCKEHLWIVNFNGPKQLVAAGREEELTALAQAMRPRRLSGIRLKTAGAFHTPYMHEAARQLAAWCRDLTLRPPRVPVVSSMTGRLLTEVGDAGTHCALQLIKPVDWLRAMQSMQRAQIKELVQAGPGSVLCRLASDCPGWQVRAMSVTEHLTRAQDVVPPQRDPEPF